jgi:glycine/D-amino acid oxidase-like deaminating enzyme
MDDPPPNVKKIRGAHASLQQVVPALRATGIARMWAGTVDITPDALPVIGPAGGIDGLVLATGLSSHGFGIGPGVGRAVADLVAHGAAGIDLAPFRVERFAEVRVRAHHHL